MRVKTNIYDTPNTVDVDNNYLDPNFISADERNHLSKVLSQSLVYGKNFSTSTYELDMTVPEETNFKQGGDYVGIASITEASKLVIDEGKIIGTTMQDYLIAKLNREAPQFKKHIKVFVFAVGGREFNKSLAGRASDIGARSCAIYQGRNVATLAHELLHSIGLYHTHTDLYVSDPEQKFVFPNANDLTTTAEKRKATDNIMSYNDERRKTTWHWQWKILQSILNK